MRYAIHVTAGVLNHQTSSQFPQTNLQEKPNLACLVRAWTIPQGINVSTAGLPKGSATCCIWSTVLCSNFSIPWIESELRRVYYRCPSMESSNDSLVSWSIFLLKGNINLLREVGKHPFITRMSGWKWSQQSLVLGWQAGLLANYKAHIASYYSIWLTC